MAEEKLKVIQTENNSPSVPEELPQADLVRRDLPKKIGSGIFASLLVPTLFNKKLSALAEPLTPKSIAFNYRNCRLSTRTKTSLSA